MRGPESASVSRRASSNVAWRRTRAEGPRRGTSRTPAASSTASSPSVARARSSRAACQERPAARPRPRIWARSSRSDEPPAPPSPPPFAAPRIALVWAFIGLHLPCGGGGGSRSRRARPPAEQAAEDRLLGGGRSPRGRRGGGPPAWGRGRARSMPAAPAPEVMRGRGPEAVDRSRRGQSRAPRARPRQVPVAEPEREGGIRPGGALLYSAAFPGRPAPPEAGAGLHPRVRNPRSGPRVEPRVIAPGRRIPSRPSRGGGDGSSRQRSAAGGPCSATPAPGAS